MKHGMRYTPEYRSWMQMKQRCLNVRNKDYAHWGARGVTVFPDWIRSFELFYAHIGPRPDRRSLDRIDNRKGYEPGNVRWATREQQQRNRPGRYRWHVKGVIFETVDEAAAHFKVSQMTIRRWVHGAHDRRRDATILPREDCHVVSRY